MSNKNEQLYKNLIAILKLFKNRPLHLAKYLIENDALDVNFKEKILNNDNLTDLANSDTDGMIKAVYFVDISHMVDYFNSITLNEETEVESKRDISKELNDKLDKFIKQEKYEDAVRVRDYMEKNNIERRGEN
jgi:hypothetical protein